MRDLGVKTARLAKLAADRSRFALARGSALAPSSRVSLDMQRVAEAKEERGVLGPPESEQVGLSFLSDGLYRYGSSAATHAALLAVDLLLKKVPSGLVLRSEPTTQFAPLPVSLHGAGAAGRAVRAVRACAPRACESESLASLGCRSRAGSVAARPPMPLLVAGDAAFDVATEHVSVSSLIAGLDRVRVAGPSLNRRPVAPPLVGETQTAVHPRPVKARPAATHAAPANLLSSTAPSGGVSPSPDSATLTPN